MEITTHESLTSLEFELLEELPKLRILDSLATDDERQKQEEFLETIEGNLENVIPVGYVFEVIYKRDDGYICLRPKSYNPFLFIKDYSNMEVGEMCLLSSDDSIIRINEELIDDKKVKEFFSKMDKWVDEGGVDRWNNAYRNYDDELIKAEELKGKEISFNIISEAFEEHKSEKIKEEKERKLRKETEEKEEEAKSGQEEATYESKGIGVFGREHTISVDGKIIKDDGNSNEYILEDEVNKTFSYEALNKDWKNHNDTILSPIEILLNDRRVTYMKKRYNGKSYKVVYTDGKCKINEVSVPAVKIRFVLNRICRHGATEDEIKVLVKLNGMKADFVKLEELRWRTGINVSIVNKAIDDKTFEVEFLGKKKTFDWDEVKSWFYCHGGTRSIRYHFGNSNLLKFSEEMGVDKKGLFSALRKIKMLNSLGNGDDN